MIHKGTYDGTIYHNPANKFCIISVKTADQDVPQEARSTRRYKDHLIRFVATGYELPRTDAVELELDGEWKKGKYGMQLQVEQWHEIVPRTKGGVEGYLASGLIKGIGPATAAQIVSRFGVETLDILQNHPERLLEIKGITEGKLEDIKTSYAESRMLQDLMTLLSPFKITPKTAQKIYQYFGPASVDILKKSPFELCQVSGFGFLRVDAIVQKNGGDLHDPTLEGLMDQISMVFQKVYLFADTVENNIKFGCPGATHEEVVAAAKKACCHDFILTLPQGYDTVIGEGGSSLSGGEKQRISIARAILKDAPIVILDEATANVDPENEDRLQKAIEALTRDKTILMIAHRLKTVRNADQILVLDGGQIVQRGTHSQLMAQEGLYQAFVSGRKESGQWKL